MINGSTNIVDFTINSNEKATNLSTPTVLMASEKLNPTHATSILPQNNNSFLAGYSEALNHFTTTYATDTLCADNCTLSFKPDNKTSINTNTNNNNNININYHINTNDISYRGKERVKVQHLQTHTKLQNNRWNYHSFYNISAETERDISKNINNNNNNNNNNNTITHNTPNESAFIKTFNMNDGNTVAISAGTEDNFVYNNNGSSNISTEKMFRQTSHAIQQIGKSSDNHTILSGENVQQQQQQQPHLHHRTEDQENAFRRIEDVHNYAKLNRYTYSNGGSSNSSINDDEDDNDEELEEDLDNEVDDEIFADNNVDLVDSYIRNRLKPKTESFIKSHNQMERMQKVKKFIQVEEQETETHVDVETVQQVEQNDSTSPSTTTPDHHARRPMNAFLIFCKRHRAIVKERYKSLENRAITKILGDWWASLDINDKKCFTNLAQQNKDAFFSANPNFKWYKLPAPPLRTLTTRPTNIERIVQNDQEIEYENDEMVDESNFCALKSRSENYFKLADEAQMGELSTLLSGDSNKMSQCALQQALGETTQFISTHLQADVNVVGRNEILKSGKRRLHSGNSFSSNSSEDDAIPKKTSRSCKGKIYQELKNSGQITIVPKKLKSTKVQQIEQNGYLRQDAVQQHNLYAIKASTNEPSETVSLEDNTAAKQQQQLQQRTISESDSMQHCDLANFDLEEKIKELPGLSLDAYLQRKRSTKKKKKFSSKKRNSNSVSSNKSSASSTLQLSPTSVTIVTAIKDIMPQQQQQQAVGSQKRKARKESITRRDISAIENEVASLMPLTTEFTTINGGYYFNEEEQLEPSSKLYSSHLIMPVTAAATAEAVVSSNVFCHYNNVTTTTTANNNNAAISNHFNENNNISSTSDLLILAEVAAKRTELTN